MTIPSSPESFELPIEVLWTFQTCDGYLDLRMWERAIQELERVPKQFRKTLTYRQLRLRLAMERRNWPKAIRLARHLRDTDPSQPAYWLQLAYAIRRAEGLEPARTILLDAIREFPDFAVIPFNLACYECQLGHHKKAQKYLSKAFHLDKRFKEAALEDEDLDPLWNNGLAIE